MTSEDLSDLKRYFGVVAEQLGGQVRLVAEGVTTLSDRLDRVSGELGEQIHRESEDTRAVSAFRTLKSKGDLSPLRQSWRT